MELTQLIYVSRRTAELTLPVLQDVIRHSQSKNAERGITGVLLCCGRDLMQLLEGESDVVTSAFDRIAADPRHAEVKCIYAKPVKKRLFAEWSMELFDLNARASLDTDRLKRLIEDVRTRNATAHYGVEARILLTDFRQQLPCDTAHRRAASKVA